MSSKPKVIAGAEVSRRGGSTVLVSSSGTAGLIATDGTNHYAITCAHVLGRPGLQGDPNADTVYSPHYKSCCGIDNKPFGSVVRSSLDQIADNRVQKAVTVGGNLYAVDAAAIQIDNAAAWSNTADNSDVGTITAVRDLTSELGAGSFTAGATAVTTANQPLALAVMKYGKTTDLTHGTINRLTTTATYYLTNPADPSTRTAADGFLFEVDAAANETTSDSYTLDMARTTSELMFATAAAYVADLNSTPNAQLTATLGGTADAPTVTISGAVFSKPGDSGSPIVDGNHKLVGILTSGAIKPLYIVGKTDPVDVFLGRSQGVFVAPALTAISAAISASGTAVTLSFSPGQSSAGATRIVPGIAIELDSADDAAIARAEAAMRATALGARLDAVVRAHIGEIRQLVHHRRRVTVAWHRARGPAFVASALRGSARPGWPLAAELDGVAVEHALGALRIALAAEGSPQLCEALAEHGDALIALVAGAHSAGDVIERLERAGS
jgi:hypothetical protein